MVMWLLWGINLGDGSSLLIIHSFTGARDLVQDIGDLICR